MSSCHSPPNETIVRIPTVLDADACRRIADLLASRPDVTLQIEGGEDLEFLRWFPGLRRLSSLSLRLRSIDGLRHVAAGLERLGVGSIDLDLLRPLISLRRFKSGLGTVGSLELLPSVGRLESIGLYRLRGPHDLTPLGAMPRPVRLNLASTRAIASLPSLERCDSLRWLVRQPPRRSFLCPSAARPRPRSPRPARSGAKA